MINSIWLSQKIVKEETLKFYHDLIIFNHRGTIMEKLILRFSIWVIVGVVWIKVSKSIYICGNIVGMGIMMGKVEIDARGRLTIPAEIRERMNIRPGDKLSIKIGPENEIKIQKSPSKEEIFNKLVGCIKIPSDHSPSVEEIKGIWKIKP